MELVRLRDRLAKLHSRVYTLEGLNIGDSPEH